MNQMDEHTLVVGAALEGHNFSVGHQTLTGTTCPWNTFAVWRVSHLAITGFLMLGDSVDGDFSLGGVEVIKFFFFFHSFETFLFMPFSLIVMLC